MVLHYGEHDVNVPAGHGRWLTSYVPHRAVRINTGGGHLIALSSLFDLLLEAASDGAKESTQ